MKTNNRSSRIGQRWTVRYGGRHLPRVSGLLLSLLLMGLAFHANAQLVSYEWPTAPGEAMKSGQYRVWVKLGAGAERELSVLRSDAIYEGGEYLDGEAGGGFEGAHVLLRASQL